MGIVGIGECERTMKKCYEHMNKQKNKYEAQVAR